MAAKPWPGVIAGVAVIAATGNGLGNAMADLVDLVATVDHGVISAFAIGLQIAAGYYGWRGIARAFTGASAGFWSSRLGRFLIGRLVGAGLFLLLLKPASFVAGAYGWVMLRLLLLLACNLNAACNFRALQAIDGFTKVSSFLLMLAVAWAVRRRVKVFIGRASAPLRRQWRSMRVGRGGSSGFAGPVEEWRHLWKPGRLLLGKSMFDGSPIGVEDDRHFITIATNRAGKGRDAIIGNLLSWE